MRKDTGKTVKVLAKGLSVYLQPTKGLAPRIAGAERDKGIPRLNGGRVPAMNGTSCVVGAEYEASWLPKDPPPLFGLYQQVVQAAGWTLANRVAPAERGSRDNARSYRPLESPDRSCSQILASISLTMSALTSFKRKADPIVRKSCSVLRASPEGEQ